MTANDALAAAYRQAKMLLHRMTDDLSADEFAAQPVPGANSPAWVVGHLAAVLSRTAGRVGAGVPPLPAGFAERFAATKQPAAAQADLGGKEELIALFDAHADAVAAALPGVSAEKLDEPLNPPTWFADTVGQLLQFMAVHTALHAGQLSTARRALGKPPVV